MAKSKNKDLWILALVSVVVIIAIFAASIGSNQTSGHVVGGTYSATGAIWTCMHVTGNEYESRGRYGFYWVNEHDDGTKDYVEDIISYWNTKVNCERGLWSCGAESTPCNLDNEGKECICRGEHYTDQPQQYQTVVND